MNKALAYKLLLYAISIVWIMNGLYCKLLNLVPRHQLIVARILGNEHAALLTKLIGVSEILMAIWILSKIKSRLCTIAQVVIVATMNTIEFMLVPDLLLFGKINAIVATLFIVVLLVNEFYLKPKKYLSA